MNSDALGFFFQIVEIRFSFKANAFQNEIAHCVYGASRSYVLIYNVRDQIQTYMVIACVFDYFWAHIFYFCMGAKNEAQSIHDVKTSGSLAVEGSANLTWHLLFSL